MSNGHRPALPVTYERTEIKIRDHAMYATVIVRDRLGELWSFDSSSFYFDMRPFEG